MPRSFVASFESPASVEQIHSAFGEENYWLARMAAFGGAKTLSSLVVDSDGTVTVTITEDLRQSALPGMVAKLYRGDLLVVSTEQWRPMGDGRVSGEISVAATGAPGSGQGTALLAPSAAGSQLTLSATVEFKVPLVGSRIETAVAGQFADGLEEIQRFTTTWIGEHA
ncbi:MAG: DUF2505 domain-containing protein [Mycobacterium sp.]